MEALARPIIQATVNMTISNLLEKKWLTKICLVMFTVVFSILLFQGAAFSIPTKWEKVDSSLSDLLNSGWLLQGTDYHRVAYQNSISPGGLDEEKLHIFSFKKW